MLVTDDRDFLILASRDRDNPGIAFCRRGRLSIGQIITRLRLIYEVLTPAEMIGRVEFL